MLRCVFIKNWAIDAGIGVYPHEQNIKQPLRINIALFQEDTPALKLDDVIDYAAHQQRMGKIIHSKHFPLLEELAETLAASTFEDSKVKRVSVEIEKLKVLPGVESCGVVVERERKA